MVRTAATILMCVAAAAARAQDVASLQAKLDAATGEARIDAAAHLAYALRNEDPDRGLALAEEALASADQLGYEAGRGASLVAAGSNLNILGRNEDAIARFEAAVEVFRRLDDRAGEASAWRSLGVCHFDRGNLDTAIESYQRALALNEAVADPVETAKTLANIGNVYWAQGAHETSVDFQERALAAFQEAGLAIGVAGTALNLGANYKGLGDGTADPAAKARYLERAEVHLQRALSVFETLAVPRGVASAQANLARLYRDRGQLDASLDHQTRALETRRAISDRIGVLNSLRSIAEIHAMRGEYRKAEPLLEEAVRLGEAAGAKRELVSVLDAYTGLLYETGRYRQAFEMLARKAEVKGEVISAESEERIAELALRYDAEKKAKEIELLRRDQEISALSIARERAIRNAILGGGVLVVALLVVVYSRYRLKLRSARELERLARTDPLTGLPNRRELGERAEHERARLHRGGTPFCLVLADIDGFKQFNDEHGHDLGDAVLQHVSAVVRAELRTQDTVGRWGGEEFLLILPGTDVAGGVVLAERVREAVRRHRFGARGAQVAVSMTFGVAECVRGMSVDDCLRLADGALLEGKRKGKDRVLAAPDQPACDPRGLLQADEIS